MATQSNHSAQIIAFPVKGRVGPRMGKPPQGREHFVQDARGTGGLSDASLLEFFDRMAGYILAKSNGDTNAIRHLALDEPDNIKAIRLAQLLSEAPRNGGRPA